LWQVDERELVRFRCHVGHAYLAEVLLDEQSEALEAALWTAVRIFKEKTVLSRQLAASARQRNAPDAVERFEDEARVSERYSALIQEYLLSGRANYEPPGQTESATNTERT
jgi:two-component system chemotaxis response regulator CheB